MDGEIQPMKAVRRIEDSLSETHWTRSVAAGSLVVSGCEGGAIWQDEIVRPSRLFAAEAV